MELEALSFQCLLGSTDPDSPPRSPPVTSCDAVHSELRFVTDFVMRVKLGSLRRLNNDVAAHALSPKRRAPHAKQKPVPQTSPAADEALLTSSIIRPYASASITVRDQGDKGRGLVASADIPLGTLLLISRPAAVITGPPGAHLNSEDLVRAIAESPRRTKSALSLLFDGRTRHKAQTMPFLEQISQLDTNQEPATDLDLPALIRFNAYGEPYGDPSAWTLRGQGKEFSSFLGLWPAFALLNHSCKPSASTMVLKSKDELMMLVRASREIKQGEEISIAYGDVCKPLEERQSHLSFLYGFKCRCARCQREEEIAQSEPEVVRHLLMSREELTGPLAESTNEALMPVDEIEGVEVDPDESYLTIEEDTVSKLKNLTFRARVAIWLCSGLGKDDQSYLSSWVYKAYELLAMLCIGSEIQLPFFHPKEDAKGKEEGAGPEPRSGLGGLRRRLALMSRTQESAESRAVRHAYCLHLDLMEAIRARHQLLHAVAPGSYQEAALSARLMQIAREIYGIKSEEAQKALEICIASTMARYGGVKAETVAKLVSAHEENELELQ
jgi:hypothetical protein